MLNFITPINNLGYGVAGYNIFKSLFQVNPSTALYPISKPEFTDKYIQSGLDNRMPTEIGCVWPSVKMWHQNDLHMHVGHGKHIGFPIFELTEFDNEEKMSLAHCDSLFVCSSWAKEVVLDQTSFTEKNVHVVPLGVDVELFQPKVSKRPQTIFLTVENGKNARGTTFC